MSYESKFNRLTLNLTRATAEKEIKWYRATPPQQLTNGTESIISEYFATKLNGVNIGIYELRYQTISGEFDIPYWATRIELVLLTPEGYVAQTHIDSSFSSSLNNLHELAKSSAYNVEALLDQALKKN